MLTLKKKEVEEKESDVFYVGDTVRLKGMTGPTMVIESINLAETNKVACVYFDFTGNNFHRIESISVEVLTHFKPKA